MLPEIDIVLPCYNPPAGWQRSIVEFHGQVSRNYNVSYIVVDDGTTTEKVGSDSPMFDLGFPVTFITLPRNRGKGFALREGVRATSAELVLYTDIDLPFRYESMERVILLLASGSCDIVAGYRDKAYYRGTMTAFRRNLSRSFRFFMRHVLRISLHDTQCGLKAFNGKGKELFLATTTDRYLFDFEFIYAAVHHPSVRLCTVSVELKNNVVFSRMRWNVVMRESLNLLKILARSAFRKKHHRG